MDEVVDIPDDDIPDSAFDLPNSHIPDVENAPIDIPKAVRSGPRKPPAMNFDHGSGQPKNGLKPNKATQDQLNKGVNHDVDKAADQIPDAPDLSKSHMAADKKRGGPKKSKRKFPKGSQVESKGCGKCDKTRQSEKGLASKLKNP